jgi:hypothetical protein
MSSYGAQPQVETYLSSYWQNFHRLFPIIHRPTFDRTEDNLLKTAMAAIGTQYHDSPEARAKGAELNEACRRRIDLVGFPILGTSELSVFFLLRETGKHSNRTFT